MSGIVADNVERSSGLVKAASVGPSTSSSDPTVSTNPSSVGTRIINTTSGEVFVCTDITAGENVWKGQLGTTVEPPKYFGERGVCFAGVAAPGASNVIDYVTISSAGNATDFGDAVDARKSGGNQVSNGSRGISGGGGDDPGSNVIQYFAFATLGNAADFGDLSRAIVYPSAVSNGTRGIWICGSESDNVMEYVNIASLGNATDFGDNVDTIAGSASTNNKTRGIIFGGYTGSAAHEIAYITMATTGNAADFGDMDVTVFGNPGAVTDNTKGVCGGGQTPSYQDVIQYVNIASLGDASDFGDLTAARSNLTAYGNGTRGCWASGWYSPANSNVIDYVTIASLGNASDFGDLTVARRHTGGMSGDAS